MQPRRFTALAEETAAALGHGWTAERSLKLRADLAPVRELAHPDGRRLLLAAADGRITIECQYPGYGRHRRIRDGERPTATVSADRGAEALATAVIRRILPVYNEVYPQVVAAIERFAESQRAQDAAARTIAEAAGTHATRPADDTYNPKVRVPACGGWLVVEPLRNGPTVNGELVGIPVELAALLARTVAEYAAQHQD